MTIDSLYLTVEATGGYTYNENLIYLGRLNAGQEDSINIYMTAPLSDTTGYFNLSYVGHNVYSIPSSGILITSNATNINFEKAIPTEFVLHQNYPNPFNPTTKISYSLPKTSLVQLKIFNLLGQEIRTIVNEEKSAGNYEVNFDASELPSGVYIYKMQAGSFVETKKMILIK